MRSDDLTTISVREKSTRPACGLRHNKRSSKLPTVASSGNEVLLHVLVLDVVCAALVATGRTEQAALALWGLLGLMLARFALFDNRPSSLAGLVIGAAPFINLLRNLKFYSGAALFFTSVLLFWIAKCPHEAIAVWRRCRLAFPIVVGAAVYYALSFAMTGNHGTNVRVFELVCTAVLIVMAGNEPLLLRRALWGLLLSAMVMGLAAYPHLELATGSRLGALSTEEDELFGNPVTFGRPLALGVVLLVLDKGSWLNLKNRFFVRSFCLLPLLALLGLSASRTSWLIAVAAVAVGLFAASRQRTTLLVMIILAILAGVIFSQTRIGQPFFGGWRRTFGGDRNLSGATSGRSDQYVIFYRALTDSPSRLLTGYGAGSDRDVMAQTSSGLLNISVPLGYSKRFHGFWMHVGVEFGVIPLVLFFGWLVLAVWRSYRGCRSASLYLPVACLVAYAAGTLVSNSYDSISGILLGLGLLGTSLAPRSTAIPPGSPATRLRTDAPLRR